MLDHLPTPYTYTHTGQQNSFIHLWTPVTSTEADLLGIRCLLTWSLSHTGALFSSLAGCSRAPFHVSTEPFRVTGQPPTAGGLQLHPPSCSFATVCWEQGTVLLAARCCQTVLCETRRAEPGGMFFSMRRVARAHLSPEWGPSGPQCPSGCLVTWRTPWAELEG